MIFRNWVLENFPFLEDDFDALTDYELFCKMVEYMRKSLEHIETYDSKFVEFNDRLTALEHYFDNLDLQDEVNNKLDEMVEDGTLAEIINQEIFGELSEQVTQNKNDISDLQTAVSTNTTAISSLSQLVDNEKITELR